MEQNFTEPNPAPGEDANSAENNPEDVVWRYRGYNMHVSEFNTAMVHFYRAEIQRSNTWRTRLDATTNWAVLSTGAAISFSLASSDNHYGVILLNMILITLFLWIEARRYRYYELWSYRTRLLETDFFAAMLVPPFAPNPDWAEAMAETLLQPEFPISMWEAIGRRLRRNYIWIYFVLVGAWILKSYLHPYPATSWAEFITRSDLGQVPGSIMLTLGLAFLSVFLLIALLTVNLHQTSGEILPKFNPSLNLDQFLENRSDDNRKPASRIERIRKYRKQVVAQIITDKPEDISKLILEKMHRGVTALNGKGMYTNKSHTVLLVALTITEINHLKSLVEKADSNAFMIVMPAQEVLGQGFQPFTTEKTG